MLVCIFKLFFFRAKNFNEIPFLGDLFDEEAILNWLMTQKDPGGDVIEDLEGQKLIDLIESSNSLAVYFCKYFLIINFN